MKKIILLILLLISINCFSQTKVLFATSGVGFEVHDNYVYQEFLLAYPTFDTNNAVHISFATIGQATFDSAIANNCKIIVRSTTGASNILTIAKQYYPNVLLVMPTGGYPNTNLWSADLPCIVLTGAGETTNMTAYKVEFFDTYQVATCPPEIVWCPSYSNGTIAGKLTSIRDYAISNNLDSSLWAVRWNARRIGSFFRENGYIDDVNGAGQIFLPVISEIYSNEVPQDPYNILGCSLNIDQITTTIDTTLTIQGVSTTQGISLSWNAIINARSYNVYCNGDSLTNTTNLSYNYNPTRLTKENHYTYRVRAIRDNQSCSSNQIQVRHTKYNKIIMK